MSTSRFNLSEYLARIGLPDLQPEPTLACLKKIVFHHVTAFPYQNRRLFGEGKKPPEQRQVASLDPDVLFQEIVMQNGPAYCFQQMTLLHSALSAIGFELTKHFSKVILQPRTKVDHEEIATHHNSHILLLVKIDGHDYLVDPGFANESTREPLLVKAGALETECDDYFFEEFPDYWTLHSKRYDRNQQEYWFSLFRFDKQTANEIDITKNHRDLYFADSATIRSDLLLFGKVTYNKRKYVTWTNSSNSGEFRSINLDGSIRDAKTFKTEDEAREFAARKFLAK